MIFDKNNVNNSIISINKFIKSNINQNRNKLYSLIELADNTNGIITTLINKVKSLNNLTIDTAERIKQANASLEDCTKYNSDKLDELINKAQKETENLDIPKDVSYYCNEKYSEIINDDNNNNKQSTSSKDLDDWIEEQEQEQEQEEEQEEALTFDKMTEQQRREIVQREKQQEQAIENLPLGSCGMFSSEDIKGNCMSDYDVSTGSCSIYMGTDSYRCAGTFTLDESPVDFSCIKYKTEDGYVQQYTVDEETGQVTQLGLNTNTDSPLDKKCSLYSTIGENVACYNIYDEGLNSPSCVTCKTSYSKIQTEDSVEYKCKDFSSLMVDSNGEFIIQACKSFSNEDGNITSAAYVTSSGDSCGIYNSQFNDDSTFCNLYNSTKINTNCSKTYESKENNTICEGFTQDNTVCETYSISVENDKAFCKTFTDEEGNNCSTFTTENGAAITINEEGKMTITGGSCQCYGSDGNYSTTNYDEETGVKTDRSEHTDDHGVKTVETTTTDASGESTTTKTREPGYISSGNSGADSEEWQDMQEDYWNEHEGELE